MWLIIKSVVRLIEIWGFFLINNSKSDLNFANGNFDGLINLNPFFFDLNFFFDNFNFLKLLENKNQFIRTFKISNKINGKINMNIKNLSSKLV